MFILSFQFKSIAQQYQPIPDSNAVWIIEHDNGYGDWIYSRLMLSDFLDDTIINDKSYTKVYAQFEYGEIYYNGGFRNSEDGKSFFVELNSNEEILLRDFSKNQGDTLRNVLYGQHFDDKWILDFYIDSTELINNGPYTYKVMYLSTLVVDTLQITNEEPLVWMEKIGSYGGGLFNSHEYELGSTRLRCLQFNDTVYYEHISFWDIIENNITYNFGECNYPVGITEQNETAIQISVYPNPFVDKFSIITDAHYSINKVFIIDLMGNVVYRKILSNPIPKIHIKLNNYLSRGVYFLRIELNNENNETIKLVKR